MPDEHDRMTHYVVQHAATLQVATPEPRLVRTAVFFGGTRQIRPSGDGNTSRPDDFAAGYDRGSEQLILQIAMRDAILFNQLEHPLRFGNISCQWFLARDTFEPALAA